MAIQTLNGADLGGRRILVREDREDRDIKGDGANGAPAPRAPRPERAERPAGGRGAGGRGAGGPAGGRGRGRGAPEQAGESSGLQVGRVGWLFWRLCPLEADCAAEADG